MPTNRPLLSVEGHCHTGIAATSEEQAIAKFNADKWEPGAEHLGYQMFAIEVAEDAPDASIA
jgi:hypothetical protein